MNSDEIRALEQLKEANDTITSSLQNDLDILRGRYKNLEVDHEQARTHLIEALLAKDSISKEFAAFAEGKQTLTSNDPGGEEKAKKALQALKEVSCKIIGHETGFYPKRHNLLNLGPPSISFHPRNPTKPAKVIHADISRGSHLRNATRDCDIIFSAGREFVLGRVTVGNGIYSPFSLLVKPNVSKPVFRATITFDVRQTLYR